MSARKARRGRASPPALPARRLLLGGLVTLAVVAASALFSAWPSYRPIPEGTAMIRLAFTHGGDRGRRCRPLTPEEIAALPPNMRRKEICERRRPPIYVELEIDGRLAFAAELPSTGLAGDGPSRVYEKFLVPAGRHRIAVRLRENDRGEGFDYAAEREVNLEPARNLVIDFRASEGGFIFS